MPTEPAGEIRTRLYNKRVREAPLLYCKKGISDGDTLFAIKKRETGIEPVPVGDELKWLKILPQCHGFAL